MSSTPKRDARASIPGGIAEPSRLVRGVLTMDAVGELTPLLLQFARLASQAIARCRCTVRVSIGAEALHTVLAPDLSDTAPREYPVDTRIAAWVMQTQTPLLVPDVGADAHFHKGATRVSGSAICVPIVVGDAIYGTLNGWHPHPGVFNPQSLTLLTTYAAAMARVVERSHRRTRELDDARRASLLLALTRAVAVPGDSIRTLDAVMPLLLEVILCAASVLIVAGEGDDPPESHLYTKPATVVPESRLRAWAERAQSEERERVAGGGETHARTYHTAQMHVFAVPLWMGEGVLGMVYYFRPAPFDADARAVLVECSHAVGVAVYNRHLYRQTLAREERIEAVFAQVTDGLLLLDESGTVALDANEAFYQLLHIPPEAVTFPVPLAELEAHWLDDRTEAGDTDPEVSGHWVIHPDETRERFLEVTKSPVRVGDALHRLYAFHDMSEARRTDRARVEFMGLVSHELRNPVASIYGYLDMLADESTVPLTPFQRECVQSARFGVRQLWRLVDDITDLLGADLGRLMLNRQSVDVERVVVEAIDALRPLLIAKRLHVDVRTAAPIPETLADPIRVQQIVINLLKNAIKFAPHDTPIAVSLDADAGEIRVRVCDNGPGVPPEDMERIFRRYEKGPQPAQQDTSGMGIGLAVVQQLVTSHGGRVWVESTPGEGSTFAFTLPIVIVEE